MKELFVIILNIFLPIPAVLKNTVVDEILSATGFLNAGFLIDCQSEISNDPFFESW